MNARAFTAALLLLPGALAFDLPGLEAKARATLARWSLEDAKLRRTVQKEMRASENQIEGDPEALDSFRKLQRYVGRVFDEEEYRAAQVVERGGAVVRPAEAPPDVRGPLGDLEVAVSAARPADLWASFVDYAQRLARAFEAEAARVWSAEEQRTLRSQALGTRLRPLDAPPSLLGDLEGFVDAVWREETARGDSGVVRPADLPAKRRGPLARAERAVDGFLGVVRDYERRRVAIVQKNVRRPMDAAPETPAGKAERFVAGLARGPLLLRATVLRIVELFDATVLPNEYDDDADEAFEAALKRGPRRGGPRR